MPLTKRSCRAYGRGALLVVVGLACLPQPLAAATVPDPKAWMEALARQGGAGDWAGFSNTVLAAASENLPPAKIKTVLDILLKATEDQTAIYGDIIQSETLGTSIYRGVVIITFDDSKPIFLLADFLRVSTGWTMRFVAFNTDFNDILATPQPYH